MLFSLLKHYLDTDTTLKLSQSVYCFTTSISHGVENYFPRLWGTGIFDAIFKSTLLPYEIRLWGSKLLWVVNLLSKFNCKFIRLHGTVPLVTSEIKFLLLKSNSYLVYYPGSFIQKSS